MNKPTNLIPTLLPINRRFSTYRNVQQSEIKPQVVSTPKNDPKKIKWGAPTWYLFHTLAHKVKDHSFSLIKNDLINNIISICNNLPCPKCATHASEYMSKINPNAIRTKDDFKNMLFKFHNDVNTRTGALPFSYDELDDKYSNAITSNIIQTFFIFFQDKSFNVSAIANTMHRTRIIEMLKKWFFQNIHYFDL
jgi:hypothetical protein